MNSRPVSSVTIASRKLMRLPGADYSRVSTQLAERHRAQDLDGHAAKTAFFQGQPGVSRTVFQHRGYQRGGRGAVLETRPPGAFRVLGGVVVAVDLAFFLRDLAGDEVCRLLAHRAPYFWCVLRH